MTEWMEHLLYEEIRHIRLVAQALKWTPERVVKTPLTILIRELACKVLELKTTETSKNHNEQLLETIERFLEENKK
jgi:hypothetical protein